MAFAKVIRDNRATLIAGLAVAAILLLACLLFRPSGATSAPLVARIHDADGGVQELPLAEDGTITVESSQGRNVVAVRGGAALMLEADCPHGDCLHQQPISAPGQQLICLPHQLWVEVVEQGGPDGQLDVTAASSADGLDLVSR